MAGSENPNDPVEHKVLTGDQKLYPGAFVTFKIKVGLDSKA